MAAACFPRSFLCVGGALKPLNCRAASSSAGVRFLTVRGLRGLDVRVGLLVLDGMADYQVVCGIGNSIL